MRRIFVLHHEDALLKSYQEMLSAMGYEVFATSNRYQFLLYAGEILADFFIFDAEDRPDADFIRLLKNQKKAKNVPLLLIMKKTPKTYAQPDFPPEVTHILFKPFALADFINILQKYEKNGQNSAKNRFFYVENKQKSQDLPNNLS